MPSFPPATSIELVDNMILREAFLASGRTPSSVCREIGWKSNDTTRLKRALGLKPATCGPERRVTDPKNWRSRSGTYFNKRLTVENALKIGAALGVAPRDMDL